MNTKNIVFGKITPLIKKIIKSRINLKSSGVMTGATGANERAGNSAGWELTNHWLRRRGIDQSPAA